MQEIFTRLGLSAKETQTFLKLLELGAQPVSVVAKHVGIPRSTMYFIVDQLKKEKTNIGYDINKDEYVEMLESGVIDPAKVTRTALQNAASIAGLLLTTEALVTDIPEKDKAPMHPQMPPEY